MTRTIVNPPALHDPVPMGYSHTVSAPAGELVHIAGQYAAGLDGHVTPADFADQVDLAFVNLGVALEAVGLGVDHVVRLGTYIVDHDLEKLAIVGAVLHRTWGDELPAQTLVGVAALAMPDMHFEVDAVAARP